MAGVLLQNGPSETIHAGERSELFRYFGVVYLKTCVGELSQYRDWLRAGRSEDRIPMGARISAPVQTGPGAPHSHQYNGYRVFPGGKAAGA